MGRIVGIDLGTTNSVVAVVEPFKNNIKILHNKEGDYKTRSVVGYWKDEYRIGNSALRLLGIAPQNTIVSIKRLMGRAISDPEVEVIQKSALYKITKPSDGTSDSVCVVLGDKEYYPEDISAMILKRLKDDAEFVLGEKVTHAVITVPANFSDKQRQATWEAGLKAGLNVMSILDEPTAAAIAYGIEDKGTGEEAAKIIVVYDLGGGTFDVSVLLISAGTFLPLDLEGDMWLGGDNFDKTIVDYAVEKIRKDYRVDPTGNIKFMAGLKEEAQEAKETLSSASMAEIIIPGIVKDEFGDPIPFDIEITREQFEKMIEPLVDKTIDLVKLAIKNANLTIENISHVLMAGNASSVPLVHKKVEELFGKEKMLRNIHPKQCVAQGAALIAATGLINCPKCNYQNKLDNKQCDKCGASLQEVQKKKRCPFCEAENEREAESCAKCGHILIDKPLTLAPFSYGIQTAGDKFSIFVHKGDTVPTPESGIIAQTCYTRIPDQRIISIPVYGGNNLENASMNDKQGLASAFLPSKCPIGTAVYIKLWLNDKGFFELTAKLDDGIDLKPRILRGKGNQRVEDKLIDIENKLDHNKLFMTPDEKREIDNSINEILDDIQNENITGAMEKAENLQKKIDHVDPPLPPDSWVLAENMIALAKYIVVEYSWLIGASTYKLNDLTEQLRYAIDKNDHSQGELKSKELEAELNKLFESNPALGMLLDRKMAINMRVEPNDPVLASRFRVELSNIENELKNGHFDAANKLVEFSIRLDKDIEGLEPKGIKCPICGHENLPGKSNCEGMKDGKVCGADLRLLTTTRV